MIAFWIIMMVMCTLHLQGFCREDFILASDYSNFYIRTIESTASFTSFRKPHLVGPFGHGLMLDTAYDPVTDKIYWIERLTNWISQSEPKNCPTTIAIGRCDFDGTNSEVLIEGINNGTQCIPSVNPALELDTKSRLLFWSSADINGNISLQMSTIDGTNIQTIGEMALGYGFYTDISIDERFGDIYWLAAGDIHRVNREGDIEVVIKGEPFSQVGISSIAVDPQGNLFWTTSLPATVSRSTLQGHDMTILFDSQDESFQFARDISLFKDSIYFVQRTENQNSTDSDIYQMNKDGLMPLVQPIDFSLTSLHIHFTAAAAAAAEAAAAAAAAADTSLITSQSTGLEVQTTSVTTLTFSPKNEQQIIFILLSALCILVGVLFVVIAIICRIKNGKGIQKKNVEAILNTYLDPTNGAENNNNANRVDNGHDNPHYAQPYDSPGLSSVTNTSGEYSTVNEDHRSSLVYTTASRDNSNVNRGHTEDQKHFGSRNQSNSHVYEHYIKEPTQFYDFVPDFSQD